MTGGYVNAVSFFVRRGILGFVLVAGMVFITIGLWQKNAWLVST